MPTDVEFEPNTSVLKRMLEIMATENMGRTRLSQKANVHYNVQERYLNWLAQRGLIDYAVIESKTIVRLTEKGQIFALKLGELYY
jgi:predicted transcriptional regulator